MFVNPYQPPRIDSTLQSLLSLLNHKQVRNVATQRRLQFTNSL